MKPIWSGFIFFRLIIFGNGGVSVRHCCAKPWPGVGVVNFGRRALGFIRGCRWVLANTVALRFADLKGRRMGWETETRWRWGSSSFCFDFFWVPLLFLWRTKQTGTLVQVDRFWVQGNFPAWSPDSFDCTVFVTSTFCPHRLKMTGFPFFSFFGHYTILF